jgi:hypothetical protein
MKKQPRRSRGAKPARNETHELTVEQLARARGGYLAFEDYDTTGGQP